MTKTKTITHESELVAKFEPLDYVDLLAVEMIRPYLPSKGRLGAKQFSEVISRYWKIRQGLGEAHLEHPNAGKIKIKRPYKIAIVTAE